MSYLLLHQILFKEEVSLKSIHLHQFLSPCPYSPGFCVSIPPCLHIPSENISVLRKTPILTPAHVKLTNQQALTPGCSKRRSKSGMVIERFRWIIISSSPNKLLVFHLPGPTTAAISLSDLTSCRILLFSCTVTIAGLLAELNQI